MLLAGKNWHYGVVSLPSDKAQRFDIYEHER